MHNRESLLREMAHRTGMLPAQLELISRTAPLRYKVFTIPKRDGTPRLVAQPAREVKALQRYLVGVLTPLLPIHRAATAYRDGLSIKDNAKRHHDGKFLLKMDLKDFFPSIEARDIFRHLSIHARGYGDESALKLITVLFTWAPERRPPLRLCIGAPSSPLISNSILHDFDSRLMQACIDRSVTYTRYADDLIFSSKHRNHLTDLPATVEDLLNNIEYPRLQINRKKTVRAGSGDLHLITGVVVTPEGALSAGRERKRLARSMFYRFQNNLLTQSEEERMWGLLAFIDHIEPGFSAKLRQKQ